MLDVVLGGDREKKKRIPKPLSYTEVVDWNTINIVENPY